jgi:hypothetical protein
MIHLIQLHIFNSGNLLGPEEMNNCGKMMCMGTMDRGFAIPLFMGPYVDISMYYINQNNNRCG